MENELNEGDVVKLKSGGPIMTIKIYNSLRGGYVCQWFVKTDLKEGVFSAAQLVIVPEDEY